MRSHEEDVAEAIIEAILRVSVGVSPGADSRGAFGTSRTRWPTTSWAKEADGWHQR